jgi:transcriptional regulator with XRE-family HTH domain
MTEFDKLLASIPTDIAEDIAAEVNDYLDFAILVRDWLEVKGWTQKELAQKLGMKPSQLSLILSGNTNLTLKTIRRFERALSEKFFSFVQSPLDDATHKQSRLTTTQSLSKEYSINSEGRLSPNNGTTAWRYTQSAVRYPVQYA